MISGPFSICHLIDANIETAYFRSIARCCDRRRFPVMIGSLAPEGALQRAMRQLDTHTFSLDAASRGRYMAAIVRLSRLLKREGVAIVHAHCFDPTFVGLMAARMAGVGFVFTRHHSDHNIRLGKRWHTRIDAWCARRADHVIAVSEATRRIMVEVEGAPVEKITVVHNGMEPLRTPTAEAVDAVRRELGLGDEKVLLMIGRLHEEKGHRYLFYALPAIRARAGRVRVLIAGEGPHRAEVEADAVRAGVRDAVEFLGRRNDIPELIAASDVVVMPSLAESFGFAALEAMSLGRPVVAAATGGIPEVVTDEKTGLLVRPKDAAALGEGVVRVLEDSGLRRRLGEAGRGSASVFTFERMMRGYEDVYERYITEETK
ncbi:MAG: glycosyltransferase family 4 protein [Blastocatellales bacterium]|nr:glycosyltransferase family 4 protein [Blastocatellales bacterium]